MSGDELRERRQALGLTQEQLASLLGVASNTVARWEREERGIPPTLPLALETLEQRMQEPANTRKPRRSSGKT